jgi:hypothetical protein
MIDEYPIRTLPSIPMWSENYAVMLADPVAAVSVYYSCGRWLDDPSVWREMIGIVLPGNTVIFAKNYGRTNESKGPGAGLSRLEVIEPHKKLALRFRGPVIASTNDAMREHGFRDDAKSLCSLDIEFDGATPVWNMQGTSTEAATIAGSMHFEQIGTARGSVEFGGKVHRLIDGYAVRDHSRGVRDVREYRWHCWINGRFGSDLFFYLYAMQLQGSETIGMTNAAICHAGTILPARILHCDLLEKQDDFTKRHTVVLGSDLGEMEIRVAEIRSNFFTSMISPYDMAPGWTRHRNAARMRDQLVTLELKGTHGIGWWESGFAGSPL